jgi:AcrR family transcriptional regulator
MDQMSETRSRHAATNGAGVSETSPAPARKPMLRKPRGQGASRRGEILQAAKRLFIADGVGNATMRRIAAEVGVSPTALYLHFVDKEAILRAIAEDYFSELLVMLQRNQARDVPPLVKLREGLRAYVDFGIERIDEYRLTFQNRAARMDPCGPDGKLEVADRSFAVLEHSVEQLLAAGIFRAGDPITIAETIWCCMHGLTSAIVDMADKVHTPRDALIESVLDAVITGLACKEVSK